MTTPELAVLIPTRGRPGNVNKVIGAWDFTNTWDRADMVLIADADDPEIGGYRELVEMTRNPDTGAAVIKLIEMPEWMPMVHKLNATAASLAEDGTYWALGFAGDDHLPQTINWAQTYLAELHKLGTGMVYGDDGYQGRKLSTEWAVTSDAVLALGQMVPAPVEHMYCDNSMMDLFGAAGLLRYLPQVRIEHMHPIAGKAESDEQYQRVNGREQFNRDRKAYERWKANFLAGDLAKLRTIRPGRTRAGNPIVKETRKMGNRSPFPRHFKQVKGLTPEDIGITLADLALSVPPDQAIVELGVFHGKTALQMAWGAGQKNGVGNGAHIWAVDPWDLPGNVYLDEGWPDFSGARSWARYWVQSLGYSNAITLVHGFSHEVAESWSGSQVGLLFVDGDHTYDGARRDIVAWSRHLAPGAPIAVDDYVSPDFPGVRQAVDDLVAEGVLAPVTIYHERLALTRLAEGDGRVKAITGEGVSPLPPEVAEEDHRPYPAASAGPVVDAEVSTDREALEAEWERVDPEGVAALRESAAAMTDRLVTHEDEFQDIPAGVSIYDLTHAQAKHLARVRKITLGVRKDKKTETIKALEDGR